MTRVYVCALAGFITLYAWAAVYHNALTTCQETFTYDTCFEALNR